MSLILVADGSLHCIAWWGWQARLTESSSVDETTVSQCFSVYLQFGVIIALTQLLSVSLGRCLCSTLCHLGVKSATNSTVLNAEEFDGLLFQAVLDTVQCVSFLCYK